MMDELAVLFVSLVAAISPGPDFFIVVRNSLAYSRRIGFFTSFGVGAALILHLSYTLIGIGMLLAENSLAYTILKYVGAGYLFYLGVSSLFSSFQVATSCNLQYEKETKIISDFTAFKQGFLTNALNPKTALFFMSLFSQFISADTPPYVRIEYGFINWVATLSWFLFLSYLITGKLFAARVTAFRRYIDRVMGGLLIFLSLKLVVL